MEALKFANVVLGELGSVVEASGGVIDKFTGDGFLAHFGVVKLLSHKSNAEESADACWCAVRIRDRLRTLNLERHIEHQPTVEVGIGIHFGMIASGVISTLSKSELTILGSNVNIASRIESLTKEFSVDCLVSESVFELCKDTFDFQKMPLRILRGISSSHSTYWLLPTNLFLES